MDKSTICSKCCIWTKGHSDGRAKKYIRISRHFCFRLRQGDFMLKKQIVRKCFACGLSFFIMLSGASSVAVMAKDTEMVTEGTEALQTSEDVGNFVQAVEVEDECPAGSEASQKQEYGGLVGISEKSTDSESIALTREARSATSWSW